MNPGAELLRNTDLVKALSELGLFFHDYTTGDGFPSSLWLAWGYSRKQLTEHYWLELLHPDDAPRVQESYRRVMEGKTDRFREQFRIQTANGEWRWVLSRGQILSRDEHGRATQYIGADTDISDQKDVEDRLREAKRRAENAAQEAETIRVAGAIIASTLEISRTVEHVLQQALQVVPYDTASVQLLKEGQLEVIGGHGWEDIDSVLGLRFSIPGYNPNTPVVLERKPVIEGNIQQRYPAFRSHSGAHIKSWMGIPLVVRGEVIGLLAFDSSKENFFTVSHLRVAASFADHVALALSNAQLYEETHRLAMEDSLTGAASRRWFFLQANQLIVQSARYKRSLSLVMFDVDYFKDVNDRHGHNVGDDVLRTIARTVAGTLRSADVLARYGGEEFVVLLPETPHRNACEIAERLRAEIDSFRFPDFAPQLREELHVTVSVGVATYDSERDSTVDHLLTRADRALYVAKREGRNRVRSA